MQLSTPDNGRAQLITDLGERRLIARIRERLPCPPQSLVVGIGDDAAVAVPERGELQVLTTDALVEGVHFDRRFSSLADVGYKALAVNVSDVAAMGGRPRLSLLSLMLPSDTTIEDVDALVAGFAELASAQKVAVVGGNITSSPGPLVIDVTVSGSVRPRKFLRRGGGRPGDILYVTGTIGAAAAGLGWLRRHASQAADVPDDADLATCVHRYRRPEPRTRVGALLGRTRTASACMDLSDGLADAVRQIAEASGTGATLDAETIPVPKAAQEWFTSKGEQPFRAAIAGGDDYELLFAVPKRRLRSLAAVSRLARGVTFTRIGQLTTEPELFLKEAGEAGPLPEGFAHF